VSVFTRDSRGGLDRELCLRTISYGFLFYAYGMVITQSFNGAGDTWTPTWINVGASGCGRSRSRNQLARRAGLGPPRVPWRSRIAFSTVAVVSALLFRRGRWKLRRV